MTKWHGGKGSKRRPENNQDFSANWERIFGKHKPSHDAMEFIMTSTHKERKMVKIFGKENCTFCTQAKALCEQKGLEFEYGMLDEDYTFEDFAEKFPTARTFPQITVDDQPIGGFAELKEMVDTDQL